MVNSYEDWLRYAMGAVAVVLGISLCFAPRQTLFFKLGSKRAPTGARPIPRWVAALIGLSLAFVGAQLCAYKLVAHRFPPATPLRQACLAAICVCLSFGLGQFFAGWNVPPGTHDRDREDYRGSAFLGAFLCVFLALAAAYFGFVAP